MMRVVIAGRRLARMHACDIAGPAPRRPGTMLVCLDFGFACLARAPG